GADDQHLVLEALDEERADRPVDQARGQRFLFGRTTLALEEAARDLAGGVGLFLVVDGQREEVLPRLRLPGEGHVGHDGGLAERGDNRTVSLTGNLPRFQCERFLAPLDGFPGDVEHMSFPQGSTDGALPRVSRSYGGPIAAAPNPSHAPGGMGSRHRWTGAIQEKGAVGKGRGVGGGKGSCGTKPSFSRFCMQIHAMTCYLWDQIAERCRRQ